jgi:hypothetical protein
MICTMIGGVLDSKHYYLPDQAEEQHVIVWEKDTGCTRWNEYQLVRMYNGNFIGVCVGIGKSMTREAGKKLAVTIHSHLQEVVYHG